MHNDPIMKRLMENRINEAHPDPMFDEDLKKYKGKPLKELLKGLNGKLRFDITTKRPTWYGSSGFSGRANQITWEYADLIIKDISAGDGKYVDVKVIL